LPILLKEVGSNQHFRKYNVLVGEDVEEAEDGWLVFLGT